MLRGAYGCQGTVIYPQIVVIYVYRHISVYLVPFGLPRIDRLGELLIKEKPVGRPYKNNVEGPSTLKVGVHQSTRSRQLFKAGEDKSQFLTMKCGSNVNII